jgi:hypothetical protein
MSYNISRFKTKAVKLVLPKGFDFQKFYLMLEHKNMVHKFNEWAGELKVASDLKNWEYKSGSEETYFKGIVTSRGFEVKDVTVRGEGSGTEWREGILPLFEKYHGDLDAVMVWEGGDSVVRITIKNGQIMAEEELV